MAGVLGQFKWPLSRRSELCGCDYMPVDHRVQQLQEAKEILAEIFGVDTKEVDEMIRNRMEEKEPWPERFWVE